MGPYNKLQIHAMNQCRLRGVLMKILIVVVCAVPVAGIAQPLDSLDLKSKLPFHGESVYGPWSIAQSAAYAGILQGIGSPDEWGQGSGTAPRDHTDSQRPRRRRDAIHMAAR